MTRGGLSDFALRRLSDGLTTTRKELEGILLSPLDH